jgi:hypothetical protein
MPYLLTIRGPVVYVSWKGLRLGDLEAVRAGITSMSRRRSGPVVYLSRIPGSGGAFSEEARQALTDFLIALVAVCAGIHHIIEGEGFLAGARRAVVTTMAQATSRPRIFHTHATFAEAAAAIGAAYNVDLGDLAEDPGDLPSSDARVKSVPPAAQAIAKTAFRAATRIAGTPPKRRREG